jgi:kynurenine formamidase
MAPDHEHGDDCGCSDGTGRRNFMAGCGAAMAFALAGTTPGAVAAQEEDDGQTPIERLLEDAPKDWGRWGDDDELGRLNLLGSQEAFRGMKSVTRFGASGIRRFTLQLSMTGEVINPDPESPDVIFPTGDIDWPSTDTGDPAFPPRTPARRDNTTGEGGSPVAGGVAFVDDKWVTDFFLQGTTHLDALGHAWYGDEIYNGFPVSSTEEPKEFETPLLGTQGIDANPNTDDGDTLTSVDTTKGLEQADISQSASSGIAGRAVLLDVGRHLDVADENDRLPLGYGITFEDLMDTAEAQETEIDDRDILLVRTGSIERTRDPSADWAPLDEPGLLYSEELVEWFDEKDIPYVGADNLGVEKVIQTIEVDETDETIVIPLHGALMRNLGVYLNEIVYLEELADACAEDGVYQFLFTAAPLKVERGSGAPINPVVLKATERGRGKGKGT